MTKYQTADAGRAGNGRIDLATGELEFSHEDTRSDSNILPIGVSHIYLSKKAKADHDDRYGKGFRLNLQQKLLKTSEDGTKYDYHDATDTKHEFEERYYYKVDGENIYHIADDPEETLEPKHITEEFDGRLYYIENPEEEPALRIKHEVFTKLMTKTGLVLHKGTRYFKGSDRIDRRHEDIIRTEEEIESLEKSILDLGFMIDEYKRFVPGCPENARYDAIVSHQRELEDYGLRLEEYIHKLQSSKESITIKDSVNNGVQRESQEKMLERRRALQQLRKAYEWYEDELLSKQRNIEKYALDLEKFINELQSSKESITIAGSNGRESHERLLKYKQDLQLFRQKYIGYEEGLIAKQRKLEEYSLELEEYVRVLRGSGESITISESGGRMSSEQLNIHKRDLLQYKQAYDGYEAGLISRQKELEEYSLRLEEYIAELQRPKRSITKADSVVNGVPHLRHPYEKCGFF